MATSDLAIVIDDDTSTLELAHVCGHKAKRQKTSHDTDYENCLYNFLDRQRVVDKLRSGTTKQWINAQLVRDPEQCSAELLRPLERALDNLALACGHKWAR